LTAELDGSDREEDNQMCVRDVSQRMTETLSVRELSWMGPSDRKTTRSESVTSAKEELRHSVSKTAEFDGSVREEENQAHQGGISQFVSKRDESGRSVSKQGSKSLCRFDSKKGSESDSP
jgi:hypothetical protein